MAERMRAFFLLPVAAFTIGVWIVLRIRLAFEDLLDRYARHPEAWEGGPRPTGWGRSYRFGSVVGCWLRHPPEWASRDARAMRLLVEMRRLNRLALLVGAVAVPCSLLVAVVAYVLSR